MQDVSAWLTQTAWNGQHVTPPAVLECSDGYVFAEPVGAQARLERGRVVGVVSRSDIVRLLARSDDQICTEIDELLRSAELDYVVDVRDGHVVLDGSQDPHKRRVAEVIQQLRRPLDHRLHRGVLGVEDAQRVGVQPAFRVLVQHLDPKHDSSLAEILSKATRMSVSEVKGDVRVEPNRAAVRNDFSVRVTRSDIPVVGLVSGYIFHPSYSVTRPDGTLGWSGYKVSDDVRRHDLYGGGVYVFNRNDPSITTESAFEVPDRAGVRLHHVMTVNLEAGSIEHVVNDTGARVDSNAPGIPSYVVDYPAP